MGLFNWMISKILDNGDEKTIQASNAKILSTEEQRINSEISELRTKADSGDADVQFALSKLYRKASWVDNHGGLSEFYLEQAIANGCADAQCHLAFQYATGLGKPHDQEKSDEWYRKAAQNGSVAAQYSVAQQYEKYINSNIPEAAVWYERAAEGGHAESAYIIGQWYAVGKGVPQDYFKANYWLRYAAMWGKKEANTYLDNLSGMVMNRNNLHCAALLERVKQYLDSQNWNYGILQDRFIEMKMKLSCMLETCSMIIFCIDDGIASRAECILPVDQGVEAAVIEYITRANYGMYYGAFSYDFEKKRVYYETFLRCSEVLPSMEDIEASVDLTFLQLQKYGNGLWNALNGCGNPEVDVRNAEQ